MRQPDIRPLQPGDFERWLVLWEGYNQFYERVIPMDVTRMTWARFFDPYEPMAAFVAEQDGKLLGFVHYIFHRNTSMIHPICYLQDLFTTKDARGHGVGRRLIESVYTAASEAGSPRVYWLTHETNKQAMILYDKVAKASGFLQYRKDMP